MLNLINEFAEYANGTWGREAGIKVHCSTGQKCVNHLHPETNQPINFNFLPPLMEKVNEWSALPV